MDDLDVDHALAVAFNELVDTGRAARQAAWTSPRGPVHDAIDALLAYVFSEVRELADAEAALGERSPEMVSPSAHSRPTLTADAADAAAIVPMLVSQACAVTDDLRAQAETVDGTDAATLLRRVADGLEQHADALAAANAA